MRFRSDWVYEWKCAHVWLWECMKGGCESIFFVCLLLFFSFSFFENFLNPPGWLVWWWPCCVIYWSSMMLIFEVTLFRAVCSTSGLMCHWWLMLVLLGLGVSIFSMGFVTLSGLIGFFDGLCCVLCWLSMLLIFWGDVGDVVVQSGLLHLWPGWCHW